MLTHTLNKTDTRFCGYCWDCKERIKICLLRCRVLYGASFLHIFFHKASLHSMYCTPCWRPPAWTHENGWCVDARSAKLYRKWCSGALCQFALKSA